MKKVFVLGQAPPRVSSERPFGTTALYRWFESVGIGERLSSGFAYAALIDYFPGSRNGSHLAPTPAQILEARPRLLAKIRTADPDIIVPVGTLAIREVLGNPKAKLEEVIGKTFIVSPFGSQVTVIPLPHPSGASPWVHLGDNRQLLDQALKLLAYSIS